MPSKRFLRYLAPNLVTLASLSFGMLSIVASIEGRWVAAAWYVVLSVLTDKLDGFVARLVKGTSEFGVQLDSFADFLNFGLAPATLWYSFFTAATSLPFASGSGRLWIGAASFLWVLAVTFRLARYNIVGDDPRCRKIFFGAPTTLMGGALALAFLTMAKYAADGVPPSIAGATVGVVDEPRLLGALAIPAGAWRIWPALILAGAFLMVSTFKIPKLGRSRSKALTVFIFANVIIAAPLIVARMLPEYLCFLAVTWVVVSLVWGTFAPEVRGIRPPQLFPQHDPPASQRPVRPEEDVAPDDESTRPVKG